MTQKYVCAVPAIAPVCVFFDPALDKHTNKSAIKSTKINRAIKHLLSYFLSLIQIICWHPYSLREDLASAAQAAKDGFISFHCC